MIRSRELLRPMLREVGADRAAAAVELMADAAPRSDGAEEQPAPGVGVARLGEQHGSRRRGRRRAVWLRRAAGRSRASRSSPLGFAPQARDSGRRRSSSSTSRRLVGGRGQADERFDPHGIG